MALAQAFQVDGSAQREGDQAPACALVGDHLRCLFNIACVVGLGHGQGCGAPRNHCVQILGKPDFANAFSPAAESRVEPRNGTARQYILASHGRNAYHNRGDACVVIEHSVFAVG